MADRSGTEELRALIRDLGKMPKELRAELRPMLRESAQKPLQEAKQRASWSSTIPAATKLSISFSAKRAGVTIRTSRIKAQHARPYENQGRFGTFRHRVFGHNVWVNQQARPFLWPAAKPWIEETDENIGKVVDSVANRFNFK